MNKCNNNLSNCNKITIDKNCNIVVQDISIEDNYVQVFILKYNPTENTQVIIREKKDDSVIFKYQGDGFYTICRLTVPTDQTNLYYYRNGKFYKSIKEVKLGELLSINPDLYDIKVDYIYYFSTCNLRKCLVKICQDIFKSQSSVCSQNIDGSLKYKRDLLMSALSVIDYMVEIDQIEEAQRLLDEITGCNGLCSSQINIESGCGCK